MRPIPAGVAAIVLIIAGTVLFLLLNGGGRVPSSPPSSISRTPTVTRATAAESLSQTLLGVAETLRRREAPSLGVPCVSLPLAPESFYYPRLVHQSALESDARLEQVVQTRVALMAPPVPTRESFFPGLLARPTAESNSTLAWIVRSKVNLTRRQDI